MNSHWRHTEHNVMSLMLDASGLSSGMAHSLRKTPTCEGRGGRLPSCRDSCPTRSSQPETELQAAITACPRSAAGDGVSCEQRLRSISSSPKLRVREGRQKISAAKPQVRPGQMQSRSEASAA